jgi:hypothetical protein
MDCEKQQLQKCRGYEGVERIEVSEAQEKKKAGKARERRNEDRLLGPMESATAFKER